MNNLKFFLKHSIATGMCAFKEKHEGLNRSLMFHSISDSQDLYSLPLNKFASFIDILKESDECFVPFSSTSKGFSITFDDGLLDNYTHAAPFLLEAKIPFTIFMISDFVRPEHKDYINQNHLQELATNSLITIGAHGKTHRPLVSLGRTEAIEELRISKLELENIIGKEVSTMSYPHGSFNEDLAAEALKLGYKIQGTSIALPNAVNTISHLINRQCIFSVDTETSYKQKIKGQWDWLG